MRIKRNLFRDILRDKNSRKYSMTKVAAFSTLLILITASITAITIMIIEKEVDHIFIGEIIALLLTLLGFKNYNEKKGTVTDPELKDSDDLEHHDKDEIG